MDQTSYGAPAAAYPPLVNPLAVVSPQFCAPYPVDLIIARKLMTLSEGNFGVTDVNGNVMFKVKGKLFSLRDRRILLDAADNPLVSFQQKVQFFSFFPSNLPLHEGLFAYAVLNSFSFLKRVLGFQLL